MLSAISRDSMSAVYAADSAIQCAVNSYFSNLLATSTMVGSLPVARPASIMCNGTTAQSSYVTLGFGSSYVDPGMNLRNTSASPTYRVEKTNGIIQFNFSNGTCARIVVTQGYDNNTLKHKTIIDSRGYVDANSQPCNSSGPWNPRNVERAIRLVYDD